MHITVLGFEMTRAELLVIIALVILSGPLFFGFAFFDQFFGDPRSSDVTFDPPELDQEIFHMIASRSVCVRLDVFPQAADQALDS